MAYDLALADRIRAAVGARRGVSEKEMFGGIAFLLDGKMFIGVIKQDLMVRVGPEGHAAALALPHVRVMDFAGRPMVGYVYVAPPGCGTEAAVRPWVERSAAFVATIEKKVKPKAKVVKKGKRTKSKRPAAKKKR